jgi:hypothetical protein
VVVALLHLEDAPAYRRFLEAVPGIDWAVLGHGGMRLESPEKVGAARMLAALPEGKELGRLDLHVVGDSVDFADRGERTELAAILADHRRQLGEYDKPLGVTDPASLRDYYEQRHLQLNQAIAREQAALDRLPRVIVGSWFQNRLLPLDPETPDQPEAAHLADAYRRESARRAKTGKPVGYRIEEPGGKAPLAPGPRPPL